MVDYETTRQNFLDTFTVVQNVIRDGECIEDFIVQNNAPIKTISLVVDNIIQSQSPIHPNFIDHNYYVLMKLGLQPTIIQAQYIINNIYLVDNPQYDPLEAIIQYADPWEMARIISTWPADSGLNILGYYMLNPRYQAKLRKIYIGLGHNIIDHLLEQIGAATWQVFTTMTNYLAIEILLFPDDDQVKNLSISLLDRLRQLKRQNIIEDGHLNYDLRLISSFL